MQTKDERKTMKGLLVAGVAAVSLTACDALMPAKDTERQRGEETRDNIEAALEQASKPSPAVETPRPAPQPTRAAPQRPVESRFDINSEETPAQAFFMALIDETPHNIVVHPEVTGEISLMLSDVTVEEVLDIVSEVYGYHYRRNATGYIVFPATLQTRIFEIDYLDLQRSGTSRTRVSSGQVSQGSRTSRGMGG